jgi:hypothetical protein
VQPRALRGTPASLAGDDLILIDCAARGTHKNGLNDSALTDRCSKLVELGIRKDTPRVARVRLHELDGHAALIALTLKHLRFITDVADERRQSTAEPRPFCHHDWLLKPLAKRVRAE